MCLVQLSGLNTNRQSAHTPASHSRFQKVTVTREATWAH